MTNRDLRKLNRAELLELLIAQMKENESLREEIEQVRKEVEDRTLNLKSAGSIAEAALKVNGVFEAAEAAASQYLENIKRMSDLYQMAGQRAADAAQKDAEEILRNARQEAQKILDDANREAKRIRDEWDGYWEIVYNRAQKLKKDMSE